MKPLEGKVAIVTGAGRPKGIGRATALRLAEHGATVVVADLCRKYEGDLAFYGVGDDWAQLQRVVSEVEGRGARGLACKVDVTRRDEVANCVAETVTTFGRIDILFNNAGTAVGVGPFLAMTQQQWDLSLNVNVTGLFHFCQLVIPKMIDTGGGVIINTSSTAGLGAGELMCGYHTSKFAVVGFTKAIAAEFGQFGIRCNTICPGMVDTDLGDSEYEFIAQMEGITIDEARRRAAEKIALRRQCGPEEVADVVAYLCSPAAGYLSGVALPVAGGMAPGL
ncbi:MAG TPA: SDR family NAD(P)-dependent oxidoreductase [Candidatus Margulisiibacteriota bacterium]|nr:SDR family NAD(P)-dependent oxidoreductase [Candidatus Margulisiibacteriota bacterium]